MEFNDVKTGYERQLEDPSCRFENKLRISLSRRTYCVLLQDAERFTGTKKLGSGFVNRLLLNLYGIARASVGRIQNEKKQQLEKALEQIAGEEAEAEALICALQERDQQKGMDSLDLSANEKTVDRIAVREPKEYFQIRVNKANLRYLASEEGQLERKYYGDNVGRYINALLEEYATYPYHQRERIYWKELLEKFEQAMKDHCQMKIQMNTKEKKLILYIKPYGHCLDSEHLYNYLVVKSRAADEKEWRVASLRLTRIAEFALWKQSGILTKEERADIRSAIENKGVPYLFDTKEQEKVTVFLTEKGKSLYETILHLRPERRVKLDNNTFEFFCTQRQANVYFFQFGEDARILEPSDLAEDFAGRYARAAQRYKGANE